MGRRLERTYVMLVDNKARPGGESDCRWAGGLAGRQSVLLAGSLVGWVKYVHSSPRGDKNVELLVGWMHSNKYNTLESVLIISKEAKPFQADGI